jgi:hypothetical protein
VSRLPYRFPPAAAAEFYAAIDWYAARDTNAAADFAAVRLIVALPQAWPTWPGRDDLRGSGPPSLPVLDHLLRPQASTWRWRPVVEQRRVGRLGRLSGKRDK